jgi:hypothetical protein
MTVWSGELRLPGETTAPVSAAASAQAWATAAAGRARMAAMAPWPAGTASCMKRPRRLTVRTASANSRTPAATLAEYSPSEWPAT